MNTTIHTDPYWLLLKCIPTSYDLMPSNTGLMVAHINQLSLILTSNLHIPTHTRLMVSNTDVLLLIQTSNLYISIHTCLMISIPTYNNSTWLPILIYYHSYIWTSYLLMPTHTDLTIVHTGLPPLKPKSNGSFTNSYQHKNDLIPTNTSCKTHTTQHNIEALLNYNIVKFLCEQIN